MDGAQVGVCEEREKGAIHRKAKRAEEEEEEWREEEGGEQHGSQMEWDNNQQQQQRPEGNGTFATAEEGANDKEEKDGQERASGARGNKK